MTGPLLYIIQPKIKDPPPTPLDPAWFAQFSSGHLRHADQGLVKWAGEQSIWARLTEMSYAEYQRLEAESHWYE